MIEKRLLRDRVFSHGMLVLALFVVVLVPLMGWALYERSVPILAKKDVVELLASNTWRPLSGEFGLLPFIMGSVWVTTLAALLALPPSLLSAIYLCEYAGSRLRAMIGPVIDLLAGIPSVVYGIWGVLTVVPFVKNTIAPMFGIFSSGYTVLASSIVLAIMILPIIIHVVVEVLESVPRDLRDASLAIGATRWQTVKHVVVRKAAPGIAAAVVLGISRAFGETMAVIMVAGNVARIPFNPLDPAYPLPALIANNYGEMMSVPLYDSALMLAALVLLLVVLFFNVAAKLILTRIAWRAK